MKTTAKIALLIAFLLTVTILCCSCDASSPTLKGNRMVSGGDYQTFEYAYIILGDRLIAEGNVTAWRDYQSGDEIEIVIGNKVYLTYYSNVVLVTSASSKLNYSSYQDYSSSN